MPSVSDKQKRFMAAAAHNPKFANEAGISQAVAKEFNEADAAKSATADKTGDKEMKKHVKHRPSNFYKK